MSLAEEAQVWWKSIPDWVADITDPDQLVWSKSPWDRLLLKLDLSPMHSAITLVLSLAGTRARYMVSTQPELWSTHTNLLQRYVWLLYYGISLWFQHNLSMMSSSKCNALPSVLRWHTFSEIFNDSDGSLRKNVFSQVLGENFVHIAFESVKSVDPTAM